MCYFYDITTGNISKKTYNITGRHILNVNRYKFILGFVYETRVYGKNALRRIHKLMKLLVF